MILVRNTDCTVHVLEEPDKLKSRALASRRTKRIVRPSPVAVHKCSAKTLTKTLSVSKKFRLEGVRVKVRKESFVRSVVFRSNTNNTRVSIVVRYRYHLVVIYSDHDRS